MVDSVEERIKRRLNQINDSEGYGPETPQSITAFKTHLITPELKKERTILDSPSLRYNSIVTKDLGTSNIPDKEEAVEMYRLYVTAINFAHMLNFEESAGFLAAEIEAALQLSKSRGGWQQDKLNEIRGTSEYRVSGAEQLQKATGIQK